MAHATEILNAHAGLADRFVSMLEGWKEAHAKHAMYRTTVRELNELSSLELADLASPAARSTRSPKKPPTAHKFQRVLLLLPAAP